MKKSRPFWIKRSVFLGLLLQAFPSVWASSGTEGAAFLEIPVGAGPAALGSAYSALASDAYAPIYNPAGLGFLEHPELAGQHLSYLESIRYEFGSFVHPIGLGFSVQDLGSGDIAGRGPTGEPIGDFNVHYAAYSASYGRKVTDRLALGLTGKFINARIADVSAHAYAADVGLLYRANEKTTLSATANNLGSPLTFTDQGDPLPEDFHLGAAFILKRNWKSTVEGVYSRTGLLSGRVGTEWSPAEVISLRAGYKTDTLKNLSPLAGLTLGIGLHVLGQEFAYAWLPYGDLGDTQYFSLLLTFGAQEEKSRNLIRYQALRKNAPSSGESNVIQWLSTDDPEYQQYLQLLTEPPEPDRNALAPVVGGQR